MYLIQEQKISLVSKMNQKNNRSLLRIVPAKILFTLLPETAVHFW